MDAVQGLGELVDTKQRLRRDTDARAALRYHALSRHGSSFVVYLFQCIQYG